MKVKIATKEFKGLDGKKYHIFRFFESGRGWAVSNAYVTVNNKPCVLKGRVIDEFEHNGKTYYSVKLNAKSLKTKIKSFSLKPYVSRKTGKSGPHIPAYVKATPISKEYCNLGGAVTVKAHSVAQ